jgi:RNA polymerase sigma-70 factor (ECF subfamily)
VSPAVLVVEYCPTRLGVQLLQRVQGMARNVEKPANSRQDDLDLVERFLRGDPAAFAELVQQHQQDIARLVARMLGSREGVQDVVQEVFLQVFKSLSQFRGTSRLSTWVYRVGVNVALMHRRSIRSRPQLVPEEAALVPVDASPLPDEQFERRQRAAALDRLMDRLSEKKRTVFVLHELQGLSPVEIAKIVRAPVLTVRTRLFYARRELIALIASDASLTCLFPEVAADVEQRHGGAPVVPEAQEEDS